MDWAVLAKASCTSHLKIKGMRLLSSVVIRLLRSGVLRMYANDAQEPHGFIKACDSFYILITANFFFERREGCCVCVYTNQNCISLRIRNVLHATDTASSSSSATLPCHGWGGERGSIEDFVYMLILFCLLTPLLSSFRQRLSLLHSAIKLPAKAVVAAFLEAGIPVNSVDTLEVCMPL